MEVHEAANGRIALDRLRESVSAGRPFDVVVLDIMMPEVSGFDVLEQIKTRPEWSSTSVIVISGAVDWIQDLWYIDECADVYVEKRAGFLEDVATVVDRVLQDRQARSQS